MRRPSDGLRLDGFALLRLRKAALLAHWLPGLGFVVSQRGRRLIRVATHGAPHPSQRCAALELHPCEFRQFVLRLGAAADEGLGRSQLLDLDTEFDLAHFTDATTELGPNGLVRAEVDGEMGVIGFACAIDIARAEATGLADGGRHQVGDEASLDVHFDHDRELGVTLVHRAFQLASERQEQRVFEVLLDLTAVYGAEEVASVLEGV
jgi:hypothetical protein